MKIFKVLGATVLLTAALTANANVGKYISINPMSPVDIPLTDSIGDKVTDISKEISDDEELDKINKEALLDKIREFPSVELSEKERTLLEKINADAEVRDLQEKNNAHIVFLISLVGILIAGTSVGAGVMLENRNNKKNKAAGKKI